MKFKELSYASKDDPLLKRMVIHAVENASGRSKFAKVYDAWRLEVVGKSRLAFTELLEMTRIGLRIEGNWPVSPLPEGPLLVVANHPYGIADGIAILSIAEHFGRPFKILISDQLLKVPEMEPYSIPVSLDRSHNTVSTNLEARWRAAQFLKEGGVVIIFPAGFVATAPRVFDKASEMPWKSFVAKLVVEAKANVLPVHFDGQNGWPFHFVSRFSRTLRLSLLIRGFCRLTGKTITASIGQAMAWEQLALLPSRKALLLYLHDAVFSLGKNR